MCPVLCHLGDTWNSTWNVSHYPGLCLISLSKVHWLEGKCGFWWLGHTSGVPKVQRREPSAGLRWAWAGALAPVAPHCAVSHQLPR